MLQSFSLEYPAESLSPGVIHSWIEAQLPLGGKILKWAIVSIHQGVARLEGQYSLPPKESS
ncbi:MAG: hypothetical protein K2X01_05595 [Cyanobacteria bacterium]|nr:hypothetical protein [Cyanobacteriota bacterium]